MTLERLLYSISEMAIQQKIINYACAGPDIYALNGKTIKDWPVLFASPTGYHSVRQNSTVFSITLYYFDRLLEGSENEIGILSTAVEELKNIVRNIDLIPEVVTVEEVYQITNFTDTESFSDRVCGAWCTIRIEVLNDTICAEE